MREWSLFGLGCEVWRLKLVGVAVCVVAGFVDLPWELFGCWFWVIRCGL